MGFFSWITQDTKKSISNSSSIRGTFPVYMVNPLTGETFREDNYEGYGEFNGKDFYELLAEINGTSGRNEGIDLAYSNQEDIMFPILVEDKENWKMYIGSKPEDCEYQGYFYEEDEE